tara:strand:- start:62 stop:346 length:285 start_codon:yes stop_codon:yes gene_type:complete
MNKTLFKEMSVLVIVFTILFTIFGNASKDWNGIEEDNDITLFQKLFNRFYFSMVSVTTIGFGDISPKTKKLRLIMIIYSIFIGMFAYNLLTGKD